VIGFPLQVAARLTGLLLAFALLSADGASAAEEFDKYALETVGASLSSNQAGAHADLTTSFKLTQKGLEPYGRTRDVLISLPPGMIGNPQPFQRCSVAQLGPEPSKSECPQDAQLGVVEIVLAEFGTLIEPIYNMYSPGGEVVARFGMFAGPYPSLINVRLNPVDYSLTATVEGAPSAARVLSAQTTLWGVPADEAHDDLRLTPSEALEHKTPVGGRSSNQPLVPFLSNPTDCSLRRQITVTAVSYQLPGSPSTLSAPFPQIAGCEKLSFNPVLTAVTTNQEAAAPTGLDAVLRIPQSEAPKDLATSTLKSAAVTLPAGLTINPAAADGLAACGADQVGLGTANASACPDASKLGSVELEVPGLERTLKGAVYQRTPEDGRLFGLWVVTDEQGVHLKLPAEIRADRVSGQLTAVFAGIPALGGNPQVPIRELRLRVSGGPRAPLSTPPDCGTFQTHFQFDPWSGRPPASGTTEMRIASGCEKGGFSPKLRAGTVNPAGGRFGAFTMSLTREDGEANLQTLELGLPHGLLAKLAGIPLCSDAAALSAACSVESRIGTAHVAAGVGGAPLWLPRPGEEPTAVYLAGPYRGAPYSIVTKVPARAGPFDFGLVVNRSGIYVDPASTRVTVKTDPLPQILEGVPVLYRTVHVDIDRRNFTLNPTNCSATTIKAVVGTSSGAVATPSDDFQATHCADLGFEPELRLDLRGSTNRGGHPALRAVLKAKNRDAHVMKAVVTLPHSVFLEQAHIGTVCTRVQFSANQCPKGSIYGSAAVRTPLLDRPLRGRVYLRSSDNTLPDLVVALRGQIDLHLVGRIDSVRGRLRATFPSVPDAPFSKFVLKMAVGDKSLIANSRDLCASQSRALTQLKGQNGRSSETRPYVRPKCKGKRHE